jgi:hypothetical protein
MRPLAIVFLFVFYSVNCFSQKGLKFDHEEVNYDNVDSDSLRVVFPFTSESKDTIYLTAYAFIDSANYNKGIKQVALPGKRDSFCITIRTVFWRLRKGQVNIFTDEEALHGLTGSLGVYELVVNYTKKPKPFLFNSMDLMQYDQDKEFVLAYDEKSGNDFLINTQTKHIAILMDSFAKPHEYHLQCDFVFCPADTGEALFDLNGKLLFAKAERIQLNSYYKTIDAHDLLQNTWTILNYDGDTMSFGYMDAHNAWTPSCGGKRGPAYTLDRKSGKVLWGFIDERGRWVIPPKFDDVYAFRDSAAMVNVNGKYGSINMKGDYILHPKYDRKRYDWLEKKSGRWRKDYFVNGVLVNKSKNKFMLLKNPKKTKTVQVKYNDNGKRHEKIKRVHVRSKHGISFETGTSYGTLYERKVTITYDDNGHRLERTVKKRGEWHLFHYPDPN